MTHQRTVSVVYCDDVRQELNNKCSLMGCYQDELLVEKLPVVLPKFAIYVHVTTPVDRPFRSLAIRVLLSDDLLAELPISTDALSKVPVSADRKYLSATGVVMIAPLALMGLGILRVEVMTEDGVLNGLPLVVREGAANLRPLTH